MHPRPGVAEEREGDGALSTSGLTDHPEDLSGPDLKAHILDDGLPAVETEAQILHRNHGLASAGRHDATLRAVRGTYERPRLRATASPVKLTPMVRIAIIAAGATTASE